MVRRAFGVAGAGHGKTTGLNFRYAWPSADWGSLPLEGGIEAAYKRDLAASPDPDKLRAELEARFNQIRSPLRTAEMFGIEEIMIRAILVRCWSNGCGRRTRLCQRNWGRARA